MFVSTALLIYELAYYLHIKRTIATWDEEKFTHKGKISLRDVIRRYQSVSVSKKTGEVDNQTM